MSSESDSAAPLTSRQSEIRDFIIEHTESVGRAPSVREIGKHFGIRSTNGVSDHLRALERKGVLVKRARGPAVIADGSVDAWRAENAALCTLLRRVQVAAKRLPSLTAELVVVLGDIRDALGAGGGKSHG